MTSIYLDYNATTPLDDRVLIEMLPWLTSQFWNAASSHAAGEVARGAVEAARRQVATLIGARPREVVFTSGSTEANNLALKGVSGARPAGRDTLLVSSIEHKAVLDAAGWLEEQGLNVQLIPVRKDGEIDVEELGQLMGEHVLLASVMLANNETGVLQPLQRVSSLASRHGVLVHTDATQAVGKLPVDVESLGVDLLSLSAHKFYGPKGVGALYIRRGVQLEAQQHGGGHESGVRSGTLNVPGIVGLGAAAEMLTDEVVRESALSESTLVEKLTAGLVSAIPGASPVGSARRLPNTVCLHFPGADAEAVMANMPDVWVSTGSACTARVPEPSHVLIAMGLSRQQAYECIRYSVGRSTTSEEIRTAVERSAVAVERVRMLTESDTNLDIERIPT
ncbi:cysteine desulfurase family protein [Knoellia sp. CPCC 206435]|uniref:cysteine desulfurase family protein n=1 Tax=Knoellia terrae TaxID=3404797 RepID=UPI003B437947